jgi:hypothetical protein
MSEENTLDLVRWTFTPDAAKRQALVEHLTDLGLDVLVRAEGQVVAMWDEPGDADLDAVIDELWAIHGTPFDVVHEEWHRTSMEVYEADDAADRQAA